MNSNKIEISNGERFEFGANWMEFLRNISEEEIDKAKNSLKVMLEVEDLNGVRFLDIGSGSGLFSLAAVMLGAEVRSFDYDPLSVECAKKLREKYAPNSNWNISEGSVLDLDFMKKLGEFDVIYSWGVLHHTGNMSSALENIKYVENDKTCLFIAIYNDQYWVSKYWTIIKRFYNKWRILRPLLIIAHLPYLFIARLIIRFIRKSEKLPRGMDVWRDMIDWLGGFPFEVATPEYVFDFYHRRGYVLEQLRTCSGRMGCNEFVFRKK